jgi:hypothetical protein
MNGIDDSVPLSPPWKYVPRGTHELPLPLSRTAQAVNDLTKSQMSFLRPAEFLRAGATRLRSFLAMSRGANGTPLLSSDWDWPSGGADPAQGIREREDIVSTDERKRVEAAIAHSVVEFARLREQAREQGPEAVLGVLTSMPESEVRHILYSVIVTMAAAEEEPN